MPNEARVELSPGLGRVELAHLRASTAAVVGLGVIGGQTAYHLALLGVSLLAIDPEPVTPENLANQGFRAADLGKPKSVTRALQLTALNPECRIEAITARVEELGMGTLAGCDIIVTGLDSRAARACVNEVAWRLGIPWVDAAVDGTGRWLRGTVTFYDPRRADSPCYLCRFNQSELSASRQEETRQSCPSWRAPRPTTSRPTLQASTFAGIVAGYQALWTVRALLGGTADLAGRQLSIACDGRPQTDLLTLRRQPRCLFDHQRFAPLIGSEANSLGELLTVARSDLGGEADTIVFHGRNLVCDLVCPNCGEKRETLRLAEACTDDEVACGCAPGRQMAPVMLTSHLSAALASRHAQRTWRELGLPALDIVTTCRGGRSAHYLVKSSGLPKGAAANPGSGRAQPSAGRHRPWP